MAMMDRGSQARVCRPKNTNVPTSSAVMKSHVQ